ncbi:MAG: hypothetical protein QM687_04995 [Ferruginibacter sp.]
MQIIKSFFKLLVFICPAAAFAQSTYLNQGDKSIHFIDRMEIKQQRNTDLNFSTLRPFNRKAVMEQAQFLDSARMGYIDSLGADKYPQWTDLNLSDVDEYNLQSLYMSNSEWYKGNAAESFQSHRPFLKSFYKTKANFYEVNTDNFFLAINPVLQLSIGKEQDIDEALYLNTRGITVRGMIAKKVGFSAYMTENQERGPSYFKEIVSDLRAVPGMGYYKPFKKQGVDYFDARGYVTFNAAKFIDFQLGYDKNFIGNGYRSLFLSDWGNSYLFAKINTRIWKLNYQNLFMELTPQFVSRAGDLLLPKKYAAMHHLSVNVTKWLNIGLFESVVFGRKDHFDFQYLNPIIFYRHIEGTIGSPDNAMAGLDFKANVAHRLQFYGQLLLDEFKLKEIREANGWWANKSGFQLGAKYVDAFGIKNLDLQGEINRVRPFTYTHRDSIADYTHYNQPLAHPLGANFNEVVGILRYQPASKWYIYSRALFYQKGLDSTGYNAGGNIFRDYDDRYGINEGYKVAGGRKLTVINALLQVSYEFKQNFFFDLSFQQRNYKIEGVQGNTQSSMFSAGVRINMFKRQYDY